MQTHSQRYAQALPEKHTWSKMQRGLSRELARKEKQKKADPSSLCLCPSPRRSPCLCLHPCQPCRPWTGAKGTAGTPETAATGATHQALPSSPCRMVHPTNPEQEKRPLFLSELPTTPDPAAECSHSTKTHFPPSTSYSRLAKT